MNTRRQFSFGVALVALVLITSCTRRSAEHEHASDHPPGHDHHDEDAGHGDEPVVRITRWSERLELFAEYPAAVAGKEVAFFAHITVLDGFRALTSARVRLELRGPSSIDAEVQTATLPGIFRLTFVPAQPGIYRGKLLVDGAVTDAVEGFTLEVFANEPKARAAAPEEQAGRFIDLLKEQQWGVPFATEFARAGTLIPSIEVAGTIDTPPGGSAEVGAPIAGRLVPPARGLPRPGQTVRKGQVLATLAPAPSSPEEAARANLAISEAEARVGRSRAAVERAERLLRDQAISTREFEDAQREARVANETLRAARNAQQIFSGATTGAGAGSWRLVAPIDGVLVNVHATPGAAVSQGTVLFHVVDTRELWIRARVPEQDAARLRPDRDASFQIAGLEAFLPIDITGNDANASLVTLGRTVDPTSRTVDVIYALRRPDPQLRVGGLVRASVPAGTDFTGVVIARSAIVDDEGREVVYVQVDGERFEERIVRTGPRMGDLIGVVHGLAENERIVTQGAHVVRLSARSGSSEPHGHIH